MKVGKQIQGTYKMANYKISDETKNSVIKAAGTLYAKYGTNAVSVKDIAALAKVRASAINYHFGGKGKLIKAVMDYARSNWNWKKLLNYYNENQHLLKTGDGKKQLVSDLIDIFYKMLYNDGEPLWSHVLLARITLSDIGNRKILNEDVAQPILKTFENVYLKITDNKDINSARCWAIHIAGGIAILITNTVILTESESDVDANYSFFRRFQHSTTENALFEAGLK